MTFQPSSPLAQGTSYRARVTTTAEDAAGNPLAADKVWTFTTLNRVSVAPFATTISSGSLRGGSFASLATNDGGYYQVNSTSSGKRRTAAWYGRFSSVPNAVGSLEVTYSGKLSANCTQTVSVWRWTTSTWVTLDSRTVGTTEVLITRPVGGALADFVSGTSGNGEVRVQVWCKRSKPSFYSSGDFLQLSYTS
jgi:hypothetical protein